MITFVNILKMFDKVQHLLIIKYLNTMHIAIFNKMSFLKNGVWESKTDSGWGRYQ
jgi:hypothetical protein